MAAGGMAVHHDALAEALPQEQARRAHLLDDLRDRDLRAEVVARDRDGDAVRVQPRARWLKFVGLERAPVAAMNEQRERRVGRRFGWNRSMVWRALGP